jgi:cysteinyl-tRNA synthetase
VLHDTFAGTKRPLELLSPGECGVYCCGPTVYDMAHIGHARAALVPDVLVRFLRARGLRVRYVRNVTDIDDKIIARAHERGISPAVLADEYTEEYRRDLRDLGMLEPDVEPQVTQHIPEIVALIERLLARGLAYAVDGDVYYRVRAFPDYGRLSKRRVDDLRAGARVEVDERKQDPLDFALWKAARAGEPAWDSPWGPGRPGWHIECSAMSEKHLGVEFDVHTGGRDLIFPHHENEIAQSRGAHGDHSFARHWIHNGFVDFAGEKMSKSLGNFFTVREVTRLYHPEALRYFLLGVHYRSPLNFDVSVTCLACGAQLGEAAQAALRCGACGAATDRDALRDRVRFPGLEEADDRVAYVYETLAGAVELLAGESGAAGGSVAESVAGMHAAVVTALSDDLNTAAALAELSEPLSEVNRLLAARKGVDPARRRATVECFVRDMGDVGRMMGVFGRVPSEWLLERRALKAARLGLDVDRVDALVAERVRARSSRDFARADEIRAELAELGVIVRDGATGSVWSL